MKKVRDKYDVAVDNLTKHPEKIDEVWNYPYEYPILGSLFKYCSYNGENMGRDGSFIGCLTQVKSGKKAETLELTKLIMADKRIPDSVTKITPAKLKVFAEWQRKMDKMRKEGKI